MSYWIMIYRGCYVTPPLHLKRQHTQPRRNMWRPWFIASRWDQYDKAAINSEEKVSIQSQPTVWSHGTCGYGMTRLIWPHTEVIQTQEPQEAFNEQRKKLIQTYDFVLKWTKNHALMHPQNPHGYRSWAAGHMVLGTCPRGQLKIWHLRCQEMAARPSCTINTTLHHIESYCITIIPGAKWKWHSQTNIVYIYIYVNILMPKNRINSIKQHKALPIRRYSLPILTLCDLTWLCNTQLYHCGRLHYIALRLHYSLHNKLRHTTSLSCHCNTLPHMAHM